MPCYLSHRSSQKELDSYLEEQQHHWFGDHSWKVGKYIKLPFLLKDLVIAIT